MKWILLTLVGGLFVGCGLFGTGDDRCDGREGLFIQTDRSSYQVGGKAMLTVENCTGGTLSIERNYNQPPDYKLEKMVASGWNLADQGGASLYDIESDEIEAGESYKFALPVEPLKLLIDSISGMYRYQLDIYNGYDAAGVKDYLPEKERVSNTFRVTK